VSYHWNNFLWPLIVTNSVRGTAADVACSVLVERPGIDWAIICAATLMTSRRCCSLSVVPAPVRAKLHARRDT